MDKVVRNCGHYPTFLNVAQHGNKTSLNWFYWMLFIFNNREPTSQKINIMEFPKSKEELENSINENGYNQLLNDAIAATEYEHFYKQFQIK